MIARDAGEDGLGVVAQRAVVWVSSVTVTARATGGGVALVGAPVMTDVARCAGR